MVEWRGRWKPSWNVTSIFTSSVPHFVVLPHQRTFFSSKVGLMEEHSIYDSGTNMLGINEEEKKRGSSPHPLFVKVFLYFVPQFSFNPFQANPWWFCLINSDLSWRETPTPEERSWGGGGGVEGRVYVNIRTITHSCSLRRWCFGLGHVIILMTIIPKLFEKQTNKKKRESAPSVHTSVTLSSPNVCG